MTLKILKAPPEKEGEEEVEEEDGKLKDDLKTEDHHLQMRRLATPVQ